MGMIIFKLEKYQTKLWNTEARLHGGLVDWLLLSESPVIDLVQHSAVSLQVIQTAKYP